DRTAHGPSATLRRSGRARLLGEGWDAAGTRVATLMETPEPYALTARTALAIARRVAAGEAPAGYHTPATAFGPDLALDFAGVRRTDL
ncbi:saccharopine dehydrogenase, partial [Rhodovulum sp. 12E13]|uniref:hypothetical protein n=1 Tax=Rhodovulum sp. 12E13 TaxID=2203891 RepID=UPI000E178E75